jgi:hypothetical protein
MSQRDDRPQRPNGTTMLSTTLKAKSVIGRSNRPAKNISHSCKRSRPGFVAALRNHRIANVDTVCLQSRSGWRRDLIAKRRGLPCKRHLTLPRIRGY